MLEIIVVVLVIVVRVVVVVVVAGKLVILLLLSTTTTTTTSIRPGLNFDDFPFKLVMEIGLMLILADLSDPYAYRIQLPGKFHSSNFRTCSKEPKFMCVCIIFIGLNFVRLIIIYAQYLSFVQKLTLVQISDACVNAESTLPDL